MPVYLLRHILLLVLLLCFLTGCFSRLTGHDGAFTFAYQTDVEVQNFNKPLAPGSRLSMLAFENGTSDTHRIVSARSSDPRVLSVSIVDNTVVLAAGRPGSATIEVVVGTDDDRELVDRVVMTVAEPAALQLRHACTEAPVAVYPAKARISIPFELTTADGRSVIGTDYFPVRTSEGLQPAGSPQQFSVLLFDTAAPRQNVTIHSTIDTTALTMHLAETADVTDVILDPFDEHAVTTVGHSTYLGFVLLVGEHEFCQSSARTTARSLTPDICTVTADLDDDGSDHNEEQMVRITGTKFGVCTYEVTFPDANRGQGLTRTFRIAIGDFPRLDDDSTHSVATFTATPPWLAPLLALLAPLFFLPLLALYARRRPSTLA